MSKSSRILVVGPAWVGDMVMAQSLFITLKKQTPDCRIDVLAPTWTFSLLERMPEVSDSIPMTLGHGQFGYGERRRLGQSLIENAYQQAIVLPNSWKSALVPFFAKIPRRTGYLGELRVALINDIRKLDKEKLSKTVERFVALGSNSGSVAPPSCPVPKFEISEQNRHLAKLKFGLSDSGNIVGICPGAEYGPAKRWPTEYFVAVTQECIDRGWQIWIFGSDKDKAVAQQINQQMNGACRDFTGRTSMAEAVDLMSLTEFILTNDSGLMHVAAALRKKIIAIFGSSDPGFTPPLSDSAEIIYLDLDCSPCFGRECRFGHYKCLRDISPQRVLESFDTLCGS